MIDLEPIKARLEAATPGPWGGRLPYMINPVFIYDKDSEELICQVCVQDSYGNVSRFENSNSNSAFIIHAHNTDIPALIAEVERLRQDLIDERGWRDKYNQNSAMIGMALAPIRQRRDTGEPLRSDHAEVADLATEVERLRQTCRDIYDLAVLDIGDFGVSRRVARIADLARATWAG